MKPRDTTGRAPAPRASAGTADQFCKFKTIPSRSTDFIRGAAVPAAQGELAVGDAVIPARRRPLLPGGAGAAGTRLDRNGFLFEGHRVPTETADERVRLYVTIVRVSSV
ncbi:hypothetical protein EVAR_86992_1 [Eumeta japonica]|uniref:Uncharacterized protein n=1 Tax=Eumeta variegata TaxID=151549 RepID=A0A4C1W8A9_EUMVA|nr:hypothetical protein EVAR_86992_1 [Eumeta japonica]